MQELADHLKSERLQRGLSLEDISKQVSLSKNVLNAMEEGDFRKIGTPLLIRRFIASYCSALGIDAEALIEKYSKDIDAIDLQREGIERYSHAREVFRTRSYWSVLIFLFSFAGVSLVTYGGIVLYEKRQSAKTPQSLKTEGYPQQEIPSDLSGKTGIAGHESADAQRDGGTAAPAAATTGGEMETLSTRSLTAGNAGPSGAPHGEAARSGEPALTSVQGRDAEAARVESMHAGPSAASSSGEPPLQQEAGALNRLRVEAMQETWIQVRIDKTATQSALLKPGDTREWEARDTVQVVLGNAGGVNLQWNGRPLRLRGKPGSVQRLRLPDPKLMDQE